MACPFVEDVVDEGAQILRRAFIPPAPRLFRDRNDPLAFSDESLRERYRFGRPGIVYICTLLEPHISKSTHRSKALTTVQSVCIALRFFACGTFLYTIGDAEGLSKATVCREIRKVCLAIKGYLNIYITFPGHLREQMIKEAFHSIAAFPNVLGAIDCTHVRILAPPGPVEADYVNRKSFHSLNIQMSCDADYLITNIEAKWPGSTHDSRIFRASTLSHRLAQGEFNGILLGDRGYPCLPHLLTPYPDPAADAERAFNYAHAKTRARIEMTFGQLKARFQCLKSLRVAPNRACDICVTCAVLHNIACLRKEQMPPVQMEDPWEQLDPEALEAADGRHVRNVYRDTYFS